MTNRIVCFLAASCAAVLGTALTFVSGLGVAYLIIRFPMWLVSLAMGIVTVAAIALIGRPFFDYVWAKCRGSA